MSYVIESGINIPPKPHSGGRQQSEERRLMNTMEVGQSFLIDDYKRWLMVRGILTKLRPKKFSMRKSPGGWRIWRTG